jgi:hypothetical protein
MVMPRSSMTFWVQAWSSTTLALDHHTSAAPKKPKPSMVW